MTRLLVTGAGGFIGGHVLERVPSSWDLTALSRGPAPLRPFRGRWVTLPPYPDPFPDAVTDGAFDVVIHLAGNADHGLATREPWRDLEATAVYGARLLSSIDTRRIVMLSSAAVYAGLVGAVAPDSLVDPLMPYALSKLYLEGFVRSRAAEGAVDSAVIIRLYNAFGPGERPTRLVPSVANAIRSGTSFKLTANPDSLSDPVHVDDVVAALLKAAERGPSGTWDLCGGDPHRLPDQITRIAHALGAAPPRIELVPDPTQKPIRFYSDPARLADALSIALPRPFEEGVRAYGREVGWLPVDDAD